MEIPSIKVLDNNLKLLDEIDVYTSLDFVRQWQGIGSFNLVVCGHEKNLETGNLIMLGSDGHRCGIVRTAECVRDEKGTTVTVSGQTLNGLTSQRIVLPFDNADYFAVPLPNASPSTVPAEDILKTYASYSLGENAASDRQLPHFAIAPNQHRGLATNWFSRYPVLSEELQAICEYCDCGYEIYLDLQQRKFVFDCLSGIDRSVDQTTNSRVILSMDFESVENIAYTHDVGNYKNLAYCGGYGEGADRAVHAVGEGTGFQRFETFFDCGDLLSVETETAISLQQEGLHRLEEYKEVKSLNANISQAGSFLYRQHWDLGDLVTVCDKSFQLQENLRVAEVRESFEPNSFQLGVTLGKLPKRLGSVLKSFQPPVK
jgi:hypothetical protein